MVLTKARHLDRIANLRIDEGLVLDRFLRTELHRAYTQSFDGCRWRGIFRAARETQYTAPEKADGHSYGKPSSTATGINEQSSCHATKRDME